MWEVYSLPRYPSRTDSNHGVEIEENATARKRPAHLCGPPTLYPVAVVVGRNSGMMKIAVIPGDGIGPEVTREAMRVFARACEMEGFKYESEEFPFGAEHFLKTQELIPDDAFESFKSLDAIYLGAIGDPRCAPGVLERGIVGRLRWDLDMYVNLRPIKLYSDHICPIKDKKPEDIDILVVRENTEGAYLGLGGFFRKNTPDEIASMECLYTRKGVRADHSLRFRKSQRPTPEETHSGG